MAKSTRLVILIKNIYTLCVWKRFLSSHGQTDMDRSTRLVMAIKNIYTLWGRKRILHCVANADWNHYTLCNGIKMLFPRKGGNML